MLYYYLIFFFVTVGAKLLLALVMIYFLLPTDHHCAECEGETLLIEGHALVRMTTRCFPGRLQRRWCPGCGREAFARPPFRAGPADRRAGRSTPVHVPDVDHK